MLGIFDICCNNIYRRLVGYVKDQDGCMLKFKCLNFGFTSENYYPDNRGTH